MINKLIDKFYFKRQNHFVNIGTTKSGTTSLYHYLNDHPGVKLSSEKENNFFMSIGHDWNRENKLKITLRKFKFVLFSVIPLKYIVRRKYFIRCRAKKGYMSGDCSINYFYFDNGKVAKRLIQFVPEAKLILMLRNPIERVHSNFWMNFKQTKQFAKKEMNKSLFDEYVKTEEYDIPINRYAENLKKWLNYFSLKQILVIDSNDFFKDPQKVMTEVYQFLGLKNHNNDKKYWETPFANSAKEYPNMSDKSKEVLQKYFEPQVEELENILMRKFNWF